MNALQGRLGEGVLANLLQYLALNGVSGCLTLRHVQGRRGEIFFERGKAVHVLTDPLTDVVALSLLLTWTEGFFGFRDGVPTPARSLRVPLETLLLEASYQVDQATRSASDEAGDVRVGDVRVGDVTVDSVLSTRPLAERQSTVALPLAAVHLLRHLDGRSSLREIAAMTGGSFDELVSAARELFGQRLIESAGTPLAGRAFLMELTQLVVNIMGPMGEIVVEDALFDLGLDPEALPRTALTDLLEELTVHFRRDDWRRAFRQRAERLRERHGLS